MRGGLKHVFATLPTFALLVVGAFAGGCTVMVPDVAPGPTTDLSAPELGEYLTLDLRDTAGIDVVVDGETLHLLVSSKSESILALNRDVADRLALREVFFGLGTASFRDGDYAVQGKVVKTKYAVAGAEVDRIWAVVMDEDIHPDYDGAISLGAIPASVFRLVLNDDVPGNSSTWYTITLLGRSENKERDRNYAALEFTQALALHQTPNTANRKAAYYLRRAGRLNNGGEPETFTRLFGNDRIHRTFTISPQLEVGGRMLGALLVEVNEDGSVPGARTRSVDDADGVVVVEFDAKKSAYAPQIYLGRDFFSACYELEVDQAKLAGTEQVFRIRCDDQALSAAEGHTE